MYVRLLTNYKVCATAALNYNIGDYQNHVLAFCIG